MWKRAKILLCVIFSCLIIVQPTQAIKEEYIPTKIVKKKNFRIIKKVHHKPKFGKRVAGYAKRFLGVPYVWGGQSPRGFDCSGLIYFVYKHFGIKLPHSSYALSGYGRYIPPQDIMPGDLLFYNGWGHVGIYIGNGRMIHSPHSGSYVQITKLSDRDKFLAARRIKSNG